MEMSSVFAGKWELLALVAVLLAVYGALHGAAVAWVVHRHEHKLVPMLLISSPVGIAICVLATVPFVGWEPFIATVGALAIGFAPILVIVGGTWLRKGGGIR